MPTIRKLDAVLLGGGIALGAAVAYLALELDDLRGRFEQVEAHVRRKAYKRRQMQQLEREVEG